MSGIGGMGGVGIGMDIAHGTDSIGGMDMDGMDTGGDGTSSEDTSGARKVAQAGGVGTCDIRKEVEESARRDGRDLGGSCLQ